MGQPSLTWKTFDRPKQAPRGQGSLGKLCKRKVFRTVTVDRLVFAIDIPVGAKMQVMTILSSYIYTIFSTYTFLISIHILTFLSSVLHP